MYRKWLQSDKYITSWLDRVGKQCCLPIIVTVWYKWGVDLSYIQRPSIHTYVHQIPNTFCIQYWGMKTKVYSTLYLVPIYFCLQEVLGIVLTIGVLITNFNNMVVQHLMIFFVTFNGCFTGSHICD